MGRRLLIRRPLQTLGASTAARSLTVSAVVADMCWFRYLEIAPVAAPSDLVGVVR